MWQLHRSLGIYLWYSSDFPAQQPHVRAEQRQGTQRAGVTHPGSLPQAARVGARVLVPEPEKHPFPTLGPRWALGPGGSHQDKSARVARLATNDASNSLAQPAPRGGVARSVRTRVHSAGAGAAAEVGPPGRGRGGRECSGGAPSHPTPARQGGPRQPGLSELISLHAYGWHCRLNTVEGS